LLYLATNKILFSITLSWIHIVLTILSSFFFLTLPYFLTNSYEGLGGMPRRYYDIGQSHTYIFYGNFSKSLLVFACVLASGQLFYFGNLFIGLYQRSKYQNNR
jgi:heme/copper-type cytochrome/quinol oxidase subunit 1